MAPAFAVISLWCKNKCILKLICTGKINYRVSCDLCSVKLSLFSCSVKPYKKRFLLFCIFRNIESILNILCFKCKELINLRVFNSCKSKLICRSILSVYQNMIVKLKYSFCCCGCKALFVNSIIKDNISSFPLSTRKASHLG